ncbi:Gamma-glutamylcyclotransferase family protein YtfP [Andreprevotia sp. IGB-42]|uniref:gamma-glutamylcyclotransferase family protein n=1 Tax=Andreprevotia sp. IGB-42 TaxID=2497473 RepID=UPI0013574052|nr:gamma-glutamylcyclotransferase family protein [Andreprevotia sp. IGB-42]KAF0814336.1 Gamma-glutamylcyclotransferase family protein YtfP [Andreprevotia sp. IGB-42]
MTRQVFVYGTLKRGYSNHHWLEGAHFLGHAHTTARYALYAVSYPFLSDDLALYPVEGELYAVSDAGLLRLDVLEQHPDDYCRREITVQLASGDQAVAWAYFHPAPQGKLLAAGVYLEERTAI